MKTQIHILAPAALALFMGACAEIDSRPMANSPAFVTEATIVVRGEGQHGDEFYVGGQYGLTAWAKCIDRADPAAGDRDVLDGQWILETNVSGKAHSIQLQDHRWTGVHRWTFVPDIPGAYEMRMEVSTANCRHRVTEPVYFEVGQKGGNVDEFIGSISNRTCELFRVEVSDGPDIGAVVTAPDGASALDIFQRFLAYSHPDFSALPMEAYPMSRPEASHWLQGLDPDHTELSWDRRGIPELIFLMSFPPAPGWANL